MKIHMSVDMEGISGIFSVRQTRRNEADYQSGRRLLTADVNAVVRGARAAGANEVLVCDAHNTCSNILIEELEEGADVILGCPKALGMMGGIDETFDAVFLVGYHAMAGTAGAVLEHTENSANTVNIWINGQVAGEAEIAAVIAGHFGVPVAFVSGDDKTAKEARAFLGDHIVTVTVKQGIARECAQCLNIHKAHGLLEEGAKRAVEKLGDLKPYMAETPVQIKREFFSAQSIEGIEMLPGMKKLDGRTLVMEGSSMLDVLPLLK